MKNKRGKRHVWIPQSFNYAGAHQVDSELFVELNFIFENFPKNCYFSRPLLLKPSEIAQKTEMFMGR